MVLPARRPLTQVGMNAQKALQPRTAPSPLGGPQQTAPGQPQLKQNFSYGPQQIGTDLAGAIGPGGSGMPGEGGGGTPARSPAPSPAPGSPNQTIGTAGGATPGYRYAGQGAWQTTSTGPEKGPTGVQPPSSSSTVAPGGANRTGPGTANGYGADSGYGYGYSTSAGYNPQGPTSQSTPLSSIDRGLQNSVDRGVALSGGGGASGPFAQTSGQQSAPGASSGGSSGPSVAGAATNNIRSEGQTGQGQGGQGQGRSTSGSGSSGVGTSSSGLTAQQTADSAPPPQPAQETPNPYGDDRRAFSGGQNGLPIDPNNPLSDNSQVADPSYKTSGGYRTTEDGRLLATGTDGRDYAYNPDGTWTEYTNVQGFNPDTGFPYGKALDDAWMSGTDAYGNAQPSGPHDRPPDIGDTVSLGGRYFRKTQGGYVEVNADGVPVDQRGQAGQGGPGGQPGQLGASGGAAVPEGWHLNGDGSVSDAYGNVYSTRSPKFQQAIAAQQEKDMLKGSEFPDSGLSDADIEQKLAADRRQRAFDTSKALRLAMEQSARGGLSPGAQSALTAGLQQEAAIAGGSQDAQTNLQYQKMQTENDLARYQSELAKTMTIIQSAQTREGRAEALRTARILQNQIGAQNEKLLRLKHELEQPNAGQIIGGAFASLLGPFGGGLAQGLGGKL